MADLYVDVFTRMTPFVLTVLSERPGATLVLLLAAHLLAWAISSGGGIPGGWLDFFVVEPLFLVASVVAGALHVNLHGSVVRHVTLLVRLRDRHTHGSAGDEGAPPQWLPLTVYGWADGDGTVRVCRPGRIPKLLVARIQTAWPTELAIPGPALHDHDPEAWDRVFFGAGPDGEPVQGTVEGDLLRLPDGTAALDVLELWGPTTLGTTSPASVRPGHGWTLAVLVGVLAAHIGSAIVWAHYPPREHWLGATTWSATMVFTLPVAFLLLRMQPWLYRFKWRMARSYASAWLLMVGAVLLGSMAFSSVLHPRWVTLAVASFLLVGTCVLMAVQVHIPLCRPPGSSAGKLAAQHLDPALKDDSDDGVVQLQARRAASWAPSLCPPAVVVGVNEEDRV